MNSGWARIGRIGGKGKPESARLATAGIPVGIMLETRCFTRKYGVKSYLCAFCLASGSNTLRGSFSDDYIAGEDANDKNNGGDGVEQTTGGADDDKFVSGVGNDSDLAEAGADNIQLGLGEDMLRGGQGNDYVFGTSFSLATGDEEDERGQLFGNEGDDFLYIGNSDTAADGERADNFATGTFINAGTAGTVTAFNPAEDTIELHYDGTAGAAPVVAIVTNANGSANITLDGDVVLKATTPGDLAVVDIELVDTLEVTPTIGTGAGSAPVVA